MDPNRTDSRFDPRDPLVKNRGSLVENACSLSCILLEGLELREEERIQVSESKGGGGVPAIPSGCSGSCVHRVLEPMLRTGQSWYESDRADFFIADHYVTVFPQLDRLIRECATSDGNCRNVGLTILCKYAHVIINDGFDDILGAQFCWGGLMRESYAGGTVKEKLLSLKGKLRALVQLASQQPQQLVTALPCPSSVPSESCMCGVQCLKVSGDEVDTLSLDQDSTVADLQRKWRIDDLSFSGDNQVRIARDFNAYKYSEFREHYGGQMCDQKWAEAWPLYVTMERLQLPPPPPDGRPSGGHSPAPPPAPVCICSPSGRLLSVADPEELITSWITSEDDSPAPPPAPMCICPPSGRLLSDILLPAGFSERARLLPGGTSQVSQNGALPMALRARLARAWAETLKGIEADLPGWTCLEEMRTRLLLSRPPLGLHVPSEIDARLTLWEARQWEELLGRLEAHQILEQPRGDPEELITSWTLSADHFMELLD